MLAPPPLMPERRDKISPSCMCVRSSSVSDTLYPFSRCCKSSSEKIPSRIYVITNMLGSLGRLERTAYVEVVEHVHDLGLRDEAARAVAPVQVVLHVAECANE